ncbi:methyltransferase domain-containing protein [Castellaniella sp. GW247-6E4]|uniref:class I SAM-dependent methyltransferase n=1 Tax=Castellaniella sp. GW247-6E4 TaxID=3140380 RepID=UPI00331575EC
MIWLDHAMLARRLAGLTRRIAARTRPWTEYRPGHHLGRLRNVSLFVGEWLRGPGSVGAVCSSSRWLARELASHAPIGEGLVVELGAGTGIVTEALLERGISPGRLIVVERSEAFSGHLRRRFPGVTVICGDAAQLGTLLPQGLRIDALVSSLPLRSVPLTERHRIIEQWERTLDPDSALIQFTYDIRPQTRTCSCDQAFEVHDSRIVWANLPPARVLLARHAGRRQPPQ